MAENTIVFDAEVYKVQTMPSDHTVRITLDLSEEDIPVMAMLAEVRRQGIVLHVSCAAQITGAELEQDDTKRKRAIRKRA